MRIASRKWSRVHVICVAGILTVTGCDRQRSANPSIVVALEPREPVLYRIVSGLNVEHDVSVATWHDESLGAFDRLSGLLYVQPVSGASLRPVGRIGSGPGEYRSVIAVQLEATQILVLDPIARSALRFARDGSFAQRYRLQGGARSILEYANGQIVIGGRFERANSLDSVDAMLSIDTAGVPSRHVTIPFPTDRAGRRFGDVRSSRCGSQYFAVVRTDTNVVWMVSRNSRRIERTIALPLAQAHRPSGDNEAPVIFDPQRFQVSDVLGDDTGCVVIAPVIDAAGDLQQLRLTSVHPGSDTIRTSLMPPFIPVGYARDSLFLLGGAINRADIQIFVTSTRTVP